MNPDKPCILVWSSDFHRAAFALANSQSRQVARFRYYRFGSEESWLSRGFSLVLIMLDILVNRAELFTPDSDCGITRILVRLLSLLRQKSHLYLIPDGYLTTRPLSINPTNIIFHRPVTAEEVITYIDGTRFRSSGASEAPIVLVSLKRPSQMPVSVTVSLAQLMLSDAAGEVGQLAASGDHSCAADDGELPLTCSSIYVICHRTFPQGRLQDILRHTASQIAEGDDTVASFKTVEYSQINPEDVITLYTLPSTVIWEIWQANPYVTLNLYDPTPAIWCPSGRWTRDLSTSLAITRTVARSRNGKLIKANRRDDGVLIETWTLRP